jgi:hypothetical protein
MIMIKHRHIRVSGMSWMLVAFAGLLIALVAGAAPTRATPGLVTPRTLAIAHGTIHRFAQDGGMIAWIGGRHYVVHLRSVSRQTGWVLGNAGGGAAVSAPSPSMVALGGERAFWVKYSGGLTLETGILTAKPGQKKPMLIDVLRVTDLGGTYLTGLAADGAQTIVYGDATVTFWGPEVGCELTGGGVHRFIGKGYPSRIRGIPPAFAIAASVGRVAVAPAVLTDKWQMAPEAAANGPVMVYNLAGRQLARVVPQGTVREVALSWPDLAVIVVRSDGATAIEQYDARTGELVTATTMPGASNLSIGTGEIVFLVGKTIYTMHDGQPAVLWRATSKPTGLSIEGRRVAWAVSGRIKALNLPRG